jgi:hypothetical protein
MALECCDSIYAANPSEVRGHLPETSHALTEASHCRRVAVERGGGLWVDLG